MCEHSTKRLYFFDYLGDEIDHTVYDKYPILKFPGQIVEHYGSIEEMCKVKGIDFDDYMSRFARLKREQYGF